MNFDGLLRGFGISRLQEGEAMREGERGRGACGLSFPYRR